MTDKPMFFSFDNQVGRGIKKNGDDFFDEIMSIESDEDNDLPAISISQYEMDACRLLGLDIKWSTLTENEKQKFLRSKERITAFSNIDTTTNPRGPRIHEKQGIVSEIVRQNLLSENLLRSLPTIYLGSGDDIEYPLALGARIIELVDPIFDDPEAVAGLQKRLENVLHKEVRINQNGTVVMPFDFGNGQESVSLKIVPKVYYQPDMNFDQPDNVYELPEKIGLIILFASQGSGGRIEQDEEIESHIAEGGAVLNNRILVKFPNGSLGERQKVQLGESGK